MFKGDGTPENPDRFHRDDFACLPFQLDPGRYAVAYYVVTRDVLKSWDESKDDLDPARYDMPEQRFDLTLISMWDPRTDRAFPVERIAATDTTLSVKLPTRDWPRFLLIEESQPGPMIVNPRVEKTDDSRCRICFESGPYDILVGFARNNKRLTCLKIA